MSSRPFIVQAAKIGAWADEYLQQHYTVLRLWEQADPLAALEQHARSAAVLVTSVRRGCSEAMMERMPALRLISSWGVGYETIDVAAASTRGIRVTNTPDVLDDCVADMAWSLLLATARRIPEGDRYVKGGQWRTIGAFPLATKVSAKHLGILGLGRIGEAIARRGAGFDMEVRYHNRRARNNVAYGYEASLIELARWADFLVVACVGGAATRHLVSAEVMNALGPKGILVNIARGSVIDEKAMVSALVEGRLGGAGLDVLEHEPAVPSELLNMDQVTLMPHTASATHETRLAMEQLVVRNVEAFLQGRPLVTPVPE
jgi:lactate dehydrogenase-like 2-hydroxyacid dehydrogenase